jgi:hypothetical protein
MTSIAKGPNSIGCFLSQTLRTRSRFLMLRSTATPWVSKHEADDLP